MIFKNRTEAGRLLASQLLHLKDANPIVLALPRGGVPVGYEIATALNAPLDLVLVRKLGAPFNPELAIGAVVDGSAPGSFLDERAVERLGIPADYIERETREQREEIERRRNAYLSGRPRPEIAGRTVIATDDGIATGATMRIALQALRQAQPQRVVLAVPVAPPDTIDGLRPHADEVVCLSTPVDFYALGQFYEDFTQLEDEDVIALLDRAARQGAS